VAHLTIERRIMAVTQLETALRLHFEGSDYFSVITLAGAADEVFGQLLAAQGVDNSLEQIKKATSAIHLKLFGKELDPAWVAQRANHARNSLKHWAPNQPLAVTFDPTEEAKDMLNRAVNNYWALEHKLSPAMERFQREYMAA